MVLQRPIAGEQCECVHSKYLVVTLPANVAAQVVAEMREREHDAIW